jgi:hypothetical protein
MFTELVSHMAISFELCLMICCDNLEFICEMERRKKFLDFHTSSFSNPAGEERRSFLKHLSPLYLKRVLGLWFYQF